MRVVHAERRPSEVVLGVEHVASEVRCLECQRPT
jgi:hypothetical protein